MNAFVRRPLAALCAAITLSFAPGVALADAQLDKVLAGAHRSEANKARDPFRNPKPTLAFFGVKPDSTVIEVWPGGGWYTEVLSPYLRDKGRYIALFPATATRGLQNFKDKLAKHPELYDKGAIALIGVPDKLDIRPEGGADAVLTFRNVHNWLKDDLTPKYFKAFYDALKPGGVLGVVEHRAKPDTTRQQWIESGYVTEQYVIEQATAAGFKLDGKSEVNANARDTKDYPKGVWTLPPVLTLGETDKAKYQAIGESDRMTLRFVKPK
ncbi:MAG: class I SAM-dependent methyltransferase [Betaproteobacteria bacterium]|nr:class I SAM-dependent methyltransferase [Betaproteobacteria bacterium]